MSQKMEKEDTGAIITELVVKTEQEESRFFKSEDEKDDVQPIVGHAGSSEQSVHGYRAASYSITRNSLWALDILAEAGFLYDSSIFPIRHDRYGIPDAKEVPHVLKTPQGHSLVEFPLSTAKIFKYKLPIAGGGYFRLYPYALTKAGLAQINRRQQPFIFYLHPWEIDPNQPRVEASWFSRFRHYNNLEKCELRLQQLMKDFQFGTTWQVLNSIGLTDSS